MSQIFYAGLSRTEAEDAYAAWLLGKQPPHAVTLSGGRLCLSPPLSRPTKAVETEISGMPAATTENETVTASAARNFFAWRRLPGRLICAQDPAGLLVCDKATWDAATAEFSWTPLAFPNLLTDVLTEKEAADFLSVPEKELKKQRETGTLPPRLCKPSGQTALYLASAIETMKIENGTKINFNADRSANKISSGEKLPLSQNPSGGKTSATANSSEEKNKSNGGNSVSEIKIPDRALLPLLLVFTPPEAATIWGRASEEIRSAAAGAGHRAARLAADETRQSGRHRLIPRAALETLFGAPDLNAWRKFISQFL